jgi:molecular chaperone DnaK
MAKQTVDYGIDLGTTNSAIARMEKKGPRIVKSRYQSDTIPSAVAISPQGEILVGEDALKEPRLTPALRFKRLMGTQQTITLADGSAWSPVDLSAEVLKELRASVRRRYDEDISHVVITVPAMFQQPQCEATYQAAMKAGMEAVALLQEPIAAATAYLAEHPEDGYYLVYDLGGGTFDVSLVQVRAGEMLVVAHGGDNFLGGSDFDRRIYEWAAQQLREQYGSIPRLETPAGRWMLLRECELAKIRLTDDEQATIDLTYLELPTAKLELTRATLNLLISDLVDQTLRHTRARIDEAQLSPADVRAILLVGGPTQMPYIRKRLREELGIETRLEDPMTVVALGAAIHASTILKPNRAQTIARSPKSVALELHYEPVSPDQQCTVAGKVVTPENFEGEIRFANASGDWETGWIRLQNGSFVVELTLGKESVSSFTISLRDFAGKLVDATPDSIAIRWGAAPAKPVAPYHYGVALDDGAMDFIIEEGTPLPAQGRPREYRANRTIQAGSDEQFVVYFLEGHSRVARDNIKVGELRLSGRDLPYTLKEGEKIEIRMRMDESRRLSARVYIPTFDKEFPVNLTSVIEQPNPDEVVQQIYDARTMIQEMREYLEGEEQKRVARAEEELDTLEAELQRRVAADQMPTAEALQRTLHIKQSLRPIHTRHRVQIEYQRASEILELAEAACQHFNDLSGRRSAQEMRNELERCRRAGDLKGIEIVFQCARQLSLQYLVQTVEFWQGLLAWLRQNAYKATNTTAYSRAVDNAARCLAQHNLQGVIENAQVALQYLPPSERRNPFEDVILRAS